MSFPSRNSWNRKGHQQSHEPIGWWSVFCCFPLARELYHLEQGAKGARQNGSLNPSLPIVWSSASAKKMIINSMLQRATLHKIGMFSLCTWIAPASVQLLASMKQLPQLEQVTKNCGRSLSKWKHKPMIVDGKYSFDPDLSQPVAWDACFVFSRFRCFARLVLSAGQNCLGKWARESNCCILL